MVLSALAALLEKACTASRRAAGAVPSRRWRAAIAPAMPVPWGCGFSGAPPTALKRCATTPDEVGMGGIDLRIDHRDRDVGAPDHAVNVQHVELLQDVLRGVALLLGRIAPRRRRLLGAGLVQAVDVVRLHDRGHADIRHRLDRGRRGPAVGDLQTHHGRSRVGEALRRDHGQPEPSNGGLQPVGRDVAGDLHHHLVLDQAGLGGRRNIHDPALEAGQDLPSAGSGSGARRPRRRLRRRLDGALDVADHGRGAERGELSEWW